MIRNIEYKDNNEFSTKYDKLLGELQEKGINFKEVNTRTLLSDFVEMGEKQVQAIVVTEIEKLDKAVREGILPLILNLALSKEVYLFEKRELGE